MLHRQDLALLRVAPASAQRKGEGFFFSTLSQLIASLFPNKSFGGIFSEANTSDTCKAHNQQARVLKAVK